MYGSMILHIYVCRCRLACMAHDVLLYDVLLYDVLIYDVCL